MEDTELAESKREEKEEVNWFQRITHLFTLFLIFAMFCIMAFFLYKYEGQIGKNPLSIGAKKLGLECTCTSPKLPNSFMYISSDGNISYSYPTEKGREFEQINVSILQKLLGENEPR